jgi:hypothetical protein
LKIKEEIFETSDKDLITIISAKYENSYLINILFNDSTRKIVDFEPFLNNSQHPQIRKYLNKDMFKNFTVKDGNINWNDFDLIFPLEDLYNGKI